MTDSDSSTKAGPHHHGRATQRMGLAWAFADHGMHSPASYAIGPRHAKGTYFRVKCSCSADLQCYLRKDGLIYIRESLRNAYKVCSICRTARIGVDTDDCADCLKVVKVKKS